jgi:hypothetical protein
VERPYQTSSSLHPPALAVTPAIGSGLIVIIRFQLRSTPWGEYVASLAATHRTFDGWDRPNRAQSGRLCLGPAKKVSPAVLWRDLDAGVRSGGRRVDAQPRRGAPRLEHPHEEEPLAVREWHDMPCHGSITSSSPSDVKPLYTLRRPVKRAAEVHSEPGGCWEGVSVCSGMIYVRRHLSGA